MATPTTSDVLARSVASAPGKLILFGEHAVVHGRLAIATALSDLRIFVAVDPSTSGTVAITCPNLAPGAEGDFTAEWSVADLRDKLGALLGDCDVATPVFATPDLMRVIVELIQASACADLEEINGRAMVPLLFLVVRILGAALGLTTTGTSSSTGVRLRVVAQSLPAGAGIGSSAALCCATVTALLSSVSPKGAVADGAAATAGAGVPGQVPSAARQALVNEWAFVGETIIHGTPSGLDNTISCYGGALTYCKQPKIQEPVPDFPPLRVLLTNTKVPKSTGALVAGVRGRLAAFPKVVDPILTAIDEVSRTCAATVAASKGSAGAGAGTGGGLSLEEVSDRLGELMDINQELLNALGVGHSALDKVMAASRERGFHSKLTGAGGGGCALTLLSGGDRPTSFAAAHAAFSVGGAAPAKKKKEEEAAAAAAAAEAEAEAAVVAVDPSAVDVAVTAGAGAGSGAGGEGGAGALSGEGADPAAAAAAVAGAGEVRDAAVAGLVSELEAHGFQCFETKIGGPGALVHAWGGDRFRAMFLEDGRWGPGGASA